VPAAFNYFLVNLIMGSEAANPVNNWRIFPAFTWERTLINNTYVSRIFEAIEIH
jgi:hypothetical protein